MKKNSKDGVIYTPDYIVKIMLDLCGYRENTSDILNKHIVDNCCGDGAFLCEAVKRYLKAYGDGDNETLYKQLSTYIHGIEINEDSAARCYKNLTNTVIAEMQRYNPDFDKKETENIKWDIKIGDTLTMTDFDGKMDFVVANPPYINAHDIDKQTLSSIKRMRLTAEGTTDVYLAFFDKGFNMLKEDGRMCYITPSQWINNKSGRELRKFILEKKNLLGVVDFGETQVFDGVQTYVMISSFKANGNGKDNGSIIYQMPSKKVNKNVSYDSLNEEKFTFTDNDIYSQIEEFNKTNTAPIIKVRNGIATLNDNFFIKNVPQVRSNYVVPIYKASKGLWSYCFFPYNLDTLQLASLDEIRNSSEALYDYVISHKEELLNRNLDDSCADYYAYGRRQAINQTNTRRIAMNYLIKSVHDIKLAEIEPGECVYSGYYFETDLSLETIKSILNEDFITYIEGLKRYKSHGYFTFTSKELQDFINYKLSVK